ncbi:hypothetical protein HDIA_2039 [Hartmannibacter diazotrophicus]|uniref:Uncharacterized protein n=1 Tax=Hartmannibacter diazotrophicus TaxID=1482074 RepID=A0A2C9D5W4_9HYPH|nr:hypothetical protein [Hartmannibacter diazotrophicus]SON55580.1 hypothetical protein HDIA_2039 [Hartmannibacter diazotrophicus]
MSRTLAILTTGLAILCAPAWAQSGRGLVNDYPTDVRADYVFGCMKVNGETNDSLRRCSCSIDLIATIVPYKRYEEASTFISLGMITGENGALFRSTEESKASIGDLRRAQAEAEMRCF